MINKPWIAVIGPGAIGGLVAARLVRAGNRVLLVGRDERWLRRFRKSGLRVEGGVFGSGKTFSGNRIFPMCRPKGPICSAVFVCVKAGDTVSALRRAGKLVGPQTAVISLQNGLTHRSHYLKFFGRERTVFGVGFVAGARLARLHIRHAGGDQFALAAHPGNAAALSTAKRLLQKSGWKVSIAESEDRLLWTKAAVNAAGNPLGALTGRTNGELVRIPALRELLLRALREAGAAAKSAGYPFLYKRVNRMLERGCLAAPDQRNSMLQDIQAGRRTEIDSIVSPFLRAARKKRIATPVLESVHRFIRHLERKICR